MSGAGIERPISQKSDDTLDRSRFISRLCDSLISPGSKQATGAIVGLTGTWGSGKTSVLNLLDAEIRERYPASYVVRFDPWLVSGAGDLISQFFAEVIATLASDKDRKLSAARDLGKALAQYAKIVSPAISLLNPATAVLSSVSARATDALFARKESIVETRRKLIARLRALNAPIVILIDELDRIEDDEVRSIAQLVRAVADFPSVSYLLAYDAERVIQALASGSGDARGRAYLEKIVQLPVPLPILLDAERIRVLEEELKAADVQLPSNFPENKRYQKMALLLTSSLVNTPRDVKRLVGSFRIFRTVIADEVDWIDLLGFSAISARYPKTFENIRRAPERCVINPVSELENLRRVTEREEGAARRLAEVMDASENSPGCERLLQTLFPSLSSANTDRDEYSDAICERRCLYSVLRLGLLPGAVTRLHIAKLLTSSEHEIRAFLYRSKADDTLDGVIERLDEVYFETPADHVMFWTGVSTFLMRKNEDDLRSTIRMRNTADAFADVMTRAVMRNKSLLPTATNTMLHLAVGGDLAIVPNWLRDHQFGHGLFGMERRDRTVWLDKDQAIDLSERCFKQWRSRLVSGELLRSVWDLHAIYSMLNAKRWDEQCRQAFTGALMDDALFDSIALMMYGGNVYTGRNAVRELCDEHVFWRRVDERLSSPALTILPEVRDAFTKAKSRDYGD